MARYTFLLFTIFFATLSIYGQKKSPKDKPRNGEGIYLFLKRNGYKGSAAYKEFIKLNKKKLKGKEELRLGIYYLLPVECKSDSSSVDKKKKESAAYPVGTVRTIKLFGESNKKVKVSSNKLSGCCFYVVSGHGGPDPGAIGYAGKHELHEDEYAYDVALRLARRLMEEGAEVRIIIQDAKDGIRDDAYLQNSKRETCMGKEIPLNQVKRLKQRCDKINSLYAEDKKSFDYCRAIFLHVDSRSKGTQTDVFFYYPEGRQQSRQLAEAMVSKFESKYSLHQPNRGFSGTVGSRSLYVLRNASPEAVFVELGNIRNSLDQRRLVVYSNRQALGNWLAEGFIDDFKRTKKDSK